MTVWRWRRRPSCCGSPREAVTNVRRHANAENVWVTCRIDPPQAYASCVADDGSGMDSPRNDSFGLDIMQERAKRIGAELAWHPRDGGGTVLEVLLKTVRRGQRGVVGDHLRSARR